MSLFGLIEYILILLCCIELCVEDLFLHFFLSSKVEEGAVNGHKKKVVSSVPIYLKTQVAVHHVLFLLSCST